MAPGKFRIFIIIFINRLDIKTGGFMKKGIVISCLVLLLAAGCSSTYKITDFSSKEKFYETLSNSAKSNTSDIILFNDSTFTSASEIKIFNDTLSFIDKNISLAPFAFPVQNVKEIKVYNHWSGVKYGALSLLVLGTFSGFAIYMTEETNRGGPTSALYVTPIASSLIGALIGGIIGHNYIFEFNP